MNRWIATCVAAALTSAAVVGCNSNNYDPQADNAKLSSVAAQMKYPADTQSMPSPNLQYSVADNGVITLTNGGDMTLSSYNVWVNKAYVLMVNKPLAAHGVVVLDSKYFYNTKGDVLTNEPNKQSWTVQVQQNNQLMDAKMITM